MSRTEIVTHTVDSREDSIPSPIGDLISAYRKSQNGDIIEIIAKDPKTRDEAIAWCNRTQNELVKTTEKNGVYTVRIRVTALVDTFS